MAIGGKLDRCQLGHFEQLLQEEKVKCKIREAVRKSTATIMSQAIEDETTSQNTKNELMSFYKALEENPDCSEHREQFLGVLMRYARRDPVAAFIIRTLGFSAVKKFPGNFDALEAGKRLVMHSSSILDDLKTSLRTDFVTAVPMVYSTMHFFVTYAYTVLYILEFIVPYTVVRTICRVSCAIYSLWMFMVHGCLSQHICTDSCLSIAIYCTWL